MGDTSDLSHTVSRGALLGSSSLVSSAHSASDPVCRLPGFGSSMSRAQDLSRQMDSAFLFPQLPLLAQSFEVQVLALSFRQSSSAF